MNDLGTGTYFDAIGEHFYPTDIYNNQNDITNVTEGLQKIDSILGNKPMYITETGINNSNYQTEAENLVTYYNIFTNQSFIQGAYWYRMTDKGQSGSYWGLFTSSYSPKTDATSYEDYINAYES